MNCDQFLGLHDLFLDAEAGRARMDPDLFAALEEHRRTCPRCRSEVEAGEEVASALRALPVLAPPSGPALSRRAAERKGWWLVSLLSAAASLIMTSGLLWLADGRGQGFPAPAGVVRSAEEGRRFALTPEVSLKLEPRSTISVTTPTRVRIEEGRLTAWVEPGTPFTVETRAGSVSVKGTVFSVEVRNPRFKDHQQIPHSGKEPPVNSTLKSAALSAVVSVVVASGTVMVFNSRGKVEVKAGESAFASEDEAPQVIQLSQALEEMKAGLGETRKVLDDLRSESVSQRSKVEKRLGGLEKIWKESQGSLEAAKTEAAKPKDKEAQYAEVMKGFDDLSAKDILSLYQGSGSTKLADRIRELGEWGSELLVAELNGEDEKRALLAAHLAEKLKDPATIEPLKKTTLEGKDLMLRRVSSHALAFMGHDEAGDALLEVVEKETRDGGVRVNAWYGLAALGRPEAVSTFERVLDEAGGDIPADFVVDTALKIEGNKLLPALRLAYDRKTVSVPLKLRIIRTLGKEGAGEHTLFLRQVAADPEAEPSLRKAAEEALAGN